jgi:L-fuconolactonase
VLVIDTHCHVSQDWYEPVESLLFQMDRYGVASAVLVQIQGQFDNDYQFSCVESYPGRFAVVVFVDATLPDALQQLERLAGRGAQAVRLRADVRSPGADPLAIWRKANDLGMSVSCAGTPEMFAAPGFSEVVEALPGLPIVIEHLGGLSVSKTSATDGIAQKVFELARHPNVYMKIPGFGEFCRRNMPVTTPFPFDYAGLWLLHQAYEAFGPARLMWGSDYPPVSGREGYANALRFPLAELASKPETERAMIFGGVAAKLYGLDGY